MTATEPLIKYDRQQCYRAVLEWEAYGRKLKPGMQETLLREAVLMEVLASRFREAAERGGK